MMISGSAMMISGSQSHGFQAAKSLTDLLLILLLLGTAWKTAPNGRNRCGKLGRSKAASAAAASTQDGRRINIVLVVVAEYGWPMILWPILIVQRVVTTEKGAEDWKGLT
jgi:hypothetical protein